MVCWHSLLSYSLIRILTFSYKGNSTRNIDVIVSLCIVHLPLRWQWIHGMRSLSGCSWSCMDTLVERDLHLSIFIWFLNGADPLHMMMMCAKCCGLCNHVVRTQITGFHSFLFLLFFCLLWCEWIHPMKHNLLTECIGWRGRRCLLGDSHGELYCDPSSGHSNRVSVSFLLCNYLS